MAATAAACGASALGASLPRVSTAAIHTCSSLLLSQAATAGSSLSGISSSSSLSLVGSGSGRPA
eukprot:2937699-Prymnesium_polylepis.1